MSVNHSWLMELCWDCQADSRELLSCNVFSKCNWPCAASNSKNESQNVIPNMLMEPTSKDTMSPSPWYQVSWETWDLYQAVPLGHTHGVGFASPQQVQMAAQCHLWWTALLTEPVWASAGKAAGASYLKAVFHSCGDINHLSWLFQGNYGWICFLSFQ